MLRFVAVTCLLASVAHAGGIQVELASVTLSEPCQVKAEAGPQGAGPMAKSKAKADMTRPLCDRTSMQLAISAEEAGEIAIKSVELFDDKGTLIATLTWQPPNAWVEGVYKSWDQKIAAGQKLNVSYPLSQPALGSDRYKGYVLKVNVAVGGKDQALQKSVTLRRETVMPANAKT